MTDFGGFARPTSSYYRLPNDWFDIWQEARRTLSTGRHPARIIAPLKITEYVVKYTWGFSNFDKPIRLSHSDLRQGRRGKRKQRLDAGTGLSSETTLQRGIKLAITLGMIEQREDNSDAARQERYYLPRLCPDEEEQSLPIDTIFNGFERPKSNYFIVPHTWTNISASINSEVLILSILYFFRHSWGWQIYDGEIRWLDADDIAKGRRYRSQERRGERYDNGIGYTVRQIRDALEEGVSRKLLVWRERDNGNREYSLRMSWMTRISHDGYFDPNDMNEIGVTITHIGDSTSDTSVEKTVEVEEKTVEVEEKTVEGLEKDVGVEEKTVEGREKVVEVEEKTVEGREKGVEVGGKTVEVEEKTVEGREKDVDRTCKDTDKQTMTHTYGYTHDIDTPSQDTGGKTPTLSTRASVHDIVGHDQTQKRCIFFRPLLEDGGLGPVQRLTLAEASSFILFELGEWYWSESDLRRLRTNGNSRIFTPAELDLQIALDRYMFNDDFAVLEFQNQVSLLPYEEIIRELQIRTFDPRVYTDLWAFLNLPRPSEMQQILVERNTKLNLLQVQAEAWGDPDLMTALKKINFVPQTAQDFIEKHGVSMVGGWLRALLKNPKTVNNVAGVLFVRLHRGDIPPGEPMIIYTPIRSDKIANFSKPLLQHSEDTADSFRRSK